MSRLVVISRFPISFALGLDYGFNINFVRPVESRAKKRSENVIKH